MSEPSAPRVPWPLPPAALALLTWVGATTASRAVLASAALVVVAATGGALASRHRLVGWRLLATLLAPAAATIVACAGDPRNVGWFGLLVVVGWVALTSATVVVAGAVVLVATTMVAQLLLLGAAPGWVTWAVGTAFTAGACAFARRQRQLVDELRSAQAELAEWARTDERHRIAREMHDLVGHGLTVTLLHLGSARLALEDDPAGVGASLAEAERAARGSLEDVRDAVATLRAEDGDTPAAAADMPSLVATYRLAGAPVDLRVRGGELADLPPARRVALYRVVQESLTNAVRHGDGGPVRVEVEVAHGRARVVVRNAAQRSDAPGTGTGLVAMGERVQAQGGRLTAGPDDGGWRVEAVVPA